MSRFFIALRILLFALGLLLSLVLVAYGSGRAFVRLVRILDDRSASADAALARLFDQGRFTNAYFQPATGNYEVLQRHNIRTLPQASGLLLVLGWQQADGKSCVGLAFIEKIHDSYGGWKGRQTTWHCSHRAASVRFRRGGQFLGYSLAYGLSGDAAQVQVSWLGGDKRTVRPMQGAFLAVLGTYGANASRVDYLDAAGAKLAQR